MATTEKAKEAGKKQGALSKAKETVGKTREKSSGFRKEFIEFISCYDSVSRNMDYTGYVSCIAGGDVFDYVVDTYGAQNGEYSVDLGYFFGDGNYVVKTNEIGRQFSAQYPAKEVIDRCVIMNYFNDTANEQISTMWTRISVA